MRPVLHYTAAVGFPRVLPRREARGSNILTRGLAWRKSNIPHALTAATVIRYRHLASLLLFSIPRRPADLIMPRSDSGHNLVDISRGREGRLACVMPA